MPDCTNVQMYTCISGSVLGSALHSSADALRQLRRGAQSDLSGKGDRGYWVKLVLVSQSGCLRFCCVAGLQADLRFGRQSWIAIPSHRQTRKDIPQGDNSITVAPISKSAVETPKIQSFRSLCRVVYGILNLLKFAIYGEIYKVQITIHHPTLI